VAKVLVVVTVAGLMTNGEIPAEDAGNKGSALSSQPPEARRNARHAAAVSARQKPVLTVFVVHIP
jgi:hypothetical protein